MDGQLQTEEDRDDSDVVRQMAEVDYGKRCDYKTQRRDHDDAGMCFYGLRYIDGKARYTIYNKE